MPRLNASGLDVCAGIGEGIVSINRQPIAELAGGADWFDAARVLFQRCDAQGCRLLLSDGTVLDPRGANQLVCGGGKYVAWLAGEGSRPIGIHYPYAIGPDGSLAFKPNAAGGLVLLRPDGEVLDLSTGQVLNVQVVDASRVSWTEHLRPQAFGLPLPRVVDGRIDWLRRRGGWCLYQDAHGRLLLQPDTEPIGYVLHRGLAFRPDLMVLASGHLRVTWSLTEGEAPASVMIHDQDPGAPRVDLSNSQPDPKPSMRRLDLPGYWYAEALTSGAFCALRPGSHILTHAGEVPLPNGTDNALYVRCTDVGGFKMAGQSHGGLGTWEYRSESGWQIVGPSFGVNPQIYDRNGVLHIATESHQGYRYADEQNRLITGDATLTSERPFGQSLGLERFGEFTHLGGMTVGQSAFSCQAQYHSKRYVLASGSAQNIIFNRTGDSCAVAIHLKDWGTVLLWFDVSELSRFPLEQAPRPRPEPEPQPEPEPLPEPEPMPAPNLPNYFAHIQKRWNEGHGGTTEAAAARFTRIVAYDLHHGVGGAPRDIRVGIWKKDNEHGQDPDKLTFYYPDGIYMVDIVANAGASNAHPSWQNDPSHYWFPVPPHNPSGWAIPGPTPGVHDGQEPAEPGEPKDPSDLERRVLQLEQQEVLTRQAIENLRVQLDAVARRVTRLEDAPAGEPFDPTRYQTRTPVRWSGLNLGTHVGAIEKKAPARLMDAEEPVATLAELRAALEARN